MLIATLDIETAAPELTPEENRALIKIDSRWKPETVDAKLSDPDLLREARHRLAVDPRRCIIVGGAIALDGHAPEWMGLTDLLDTIYDVRQDRGAYLAGHAIDDFDLRALSFSALRLKHRACPALWAMMRAKPWDRRTLDSHSATLYYDAYSKRTTLSLDALCDIMGLPGPEPGTISGADCPQAYDEGRIDDIAAHCLDDVERERLVVLECIRAGIFDAPLPAWAA